MTRRIFVEGPAHSGKFCRGPEYIDANHDEAIAETHECQFVDTRRARMSCRHWFQHDRSLLPAPPPRRSLRRLSLAMSRWQKVGRFFVTRSCSRFLGAGQQEPRSRPTVPAVRRAKSRRLPPPPLPFPSRARVAFLVGAVLPPHQFQRPRGLPKAVVPSRRPMPRARPGIRQEMRSSRAHRIARRLDGKSPGRQGQPERDLSPPAMAGLRTSPE